MTREQSPRRALVTGSARGIGMAVARALAEQGHEVYGVDIRDQLDTGHVASTIAADLGDAAQCTAIFERLPPIDIIVNNAAILVDKPLEETTLEEIDRLLAVNLRAPILLTQRVVPDMAARGWGRVVNISGVGARTGGLASSGVYNTTKAGLISFAKYVARHYGPSGVTGNAVAPGGIQTEMMRHLTSDQREAYRALIPTGRLGSVEDVAAAVAFLVSEQAGYINGVTLDVNGGWVTA